MAELDSSYCFFVPFVYRPLACFVAAGSGLAAVAGEARHVVAVRFSPDYSRLGSAVAATPNQALHTMRAALCGWRLDVMLAALMCELVVMLLHRAGELVGRDCSHAFSCAISARCSRASFVQYQVNFGKTRLYDITVHPPQHNTAMEATASAVAVLSLSVFFIGHFCSRRASSWTLRLNRRRHLPAHANPQILFGGDAGQLVAAV